MPAEPHLEDSGPDYFVQSLGQTLGPMPLWELVTMAESGALSASDPVREGTEGSWESAGDFAEVAAAILTSARIEDNTPQIGSTTARRLQTADHTPLGDNEPPLPPADIAPDPPPLAEASGASTGEAPTRRKAVRKAAGPVKAKRKPKKEDEFLKEIFSEVFTEDGAVRDPSERAAQAPPTSAARTSIPEPLSESGAVPSSEPVAAQPATDTAAQSWQNPSSGAGAGFGGGMSGMNGMGSAGGFGAAAAAAPRPAYTPPPRPVSKSSGSGFELPEPKVLGMIGGGIAAVLLVVGMFMGFVPGLGMNTEAPLRAFAQEYQQMSQGPISPADWKAFGDRIRPQAREIVKYLNSGGSLSDEQRKHQASAIKMVQIVNCTVEEEEKRTKLFIEFTGELK
ncbi:MAG: DUF4339 domain-containing protein [Planctomycetaceae bacterium]